MAQRKRLRIWCRCWSLLLAFTQFAQVAGQSVEAEHTLCSNAATVEYLRWVPFWTRALQMGSFYGCAASELILTSSDWTQRSLSLSEASGLGPFEEGCGPVVLTVAPPMPICGYRFQTADVSELRDPVSFALHGSVDGSNWFILDEELDYNTSTSRMTRSELFETDLTNVSVEVPVQIVMFSAYAARSWTHAGHIPADLYAIRELQLMVGGEVLDLYEATVETGPDFYVGRLGTSTSTSISTTSTTGSNTTRTTSSTTISLSSTTTSSFTSSWTTVSTTSISTTSISTTSISTTSFSTTSMSVTSSLSSTVSMTSSTSSTVSQTTSTSSSLSYTSSSSLTSTSSATSTTSITSTSTSSRSTSTSTTSSTSTSTSSRSTTSTITSSTTSWTTRTWTTRTTYSTFTWWSTQTWTWTTRTWSTTTRTTTTTSTSQTSSTSTSSTTSFTSTSTSTSSTTITSTTSSTTTVSTTTSSTTTVSTTTSRSVSTSSTSTETTLTSTTTTMTTMTLTSRTSTSTLSTLTTTATTSTSSSWTTFTSTTRSTSTATSTSISTTTSSSISISSTMSSTTTSSTWRNSSLNSSYLRVDLPSPVMLQAFRYITSPQSIDRDPVQFALWGSNDNGSSWIPLYFQNETTAVPTTRGAPTAWYAMSTTTTTTLSPEDLVKDALGNLEGSKLALLGLLDGLNASGNGVLAQQVEVQADGVILVGVAMVPSENGEPVAFSYDEVTVEVPSAILEGLGAPAVAVLGLVPSSSGLFSLLNSSDGADGGLQSDILSLDLFADGNSVKELAQPIQMTFSSTAENPIGCAFLDEALNEWSTAGLSRVSLVNGTLVCATNHLSIFGAILDSAFAALACSNAAAIFSAKGFQSLGSRLWMFETAALLNWITLLAGVLLLLRARKEDNKYQSALEQINVIKSLKYKHKDENHEHEHHEHVSMKAAILDEFHHFMDGGLVRMAYSRMLRARTGLTLKDLKKMYDQSGHSSVHTKAEQFLKEFEERHLARRLSFWYRMNCIWFSVLQPSAASSSLVRTAVLLGKVYSGWAVSAVFYGATSIAPGEEDGCTPPEGAFDVFVRSLTVQIISSAFGALPFAALVIFFYKLTRLRLSVRRAVFWSFLSCYFLFCIMVISIFIASVSQVDANKWFYTSLVDLILTWFVPIMLLAALTVVISIYWMRREEHRKTGHHQALHPVLPWPAFGVLQTYEVKLGSLEVTEQRTKRRKPFIVTCEIGGCPETSQTFERLHEDDAYRVAHGVYHISFNQVLLFSVFHRKGKMPPQLRGRVFVPAVDFLEEGLNAKLPLKLNGRSSQMAIQVFFHKPKRPEVPAITLASLPSDIFFKVTEDTDALPGPFEPRQEKILAVQEDKPDEDSVMIPVEEYTEEREAAEPLQPEEPKEPTEPEELEEPEEPEEPQEKQAPTEPEVSEQLRALVDLEEEGEVPSEPPALCVRGNLLALAHTLQEVDDVITVDVDVLTAPFPADSMTMAEEPEQRGFATMPLVSPHTGNTPSVSAAGETEDESMQEAALETESNRLSVPSLSRSSRSSTSPPRKRSPGPTREEVLQKVEDSELRNLCSIAEKRQLSPLPSRGPAT